MRKLFVLAGEILRIVATASLRYINRPYVAARLSLVLYICALVLFWALLGPHTLPPPSPKPFCNCDCPAECQR